MLAFVIPIVAFLSREVSRIERGETRKIATDKIRSILTRRAIQQRLDGYIDEATTEIVDSIFNKNS